MLKNLGGATLALALVGCATAPVQSSFRNTKTVSAPFESTWEQLVGFFATRNIPLKNIAKDSGVIYAEAMSFDQSFADCGKYPLMSPQQNLMSVNVFVQKRGEQNTVSVNTTFRQILVGPYNTTQAVTCHSKGTVEGMVLDSVNNI